MGKLPTVAIIGRPNTGKSTLFNRLIGKRRAIVSEVAGTTRDLVATTVQDKTTTYLLIDTGGINTGTTQDDLERDVVGQALLALSEADVILFTVHGNEGLTSSDFTIAKILRKKSRHHVPIILTITQCDNPKTMEEFLPSFFELGFTSDIIPVSAVHNLGIDDLRKSIATHLHKLHFRKTDATSLASDAPCIAIVGKPNVGKSSLINAFMSPAEHKRAARLVSPIPGTTRDTNDTMVKYAKQEYLLVDTAGLKRKAKVAEGIDRYASLRSIQAISECDIAVLIIDATEPASNQDKRIANLALKEGKGLIILANKVDLLKGAEQQPILSSLTQQFSFCSFAPLLPVSATTQEGLLKLFPLIDQVVLNRTRRIPTKNLHRWLEDTVLNQPCKDLTQCKHITQAQEIPPTFVLFVRHPKNIGYSDIRYLDRRLRSLFAFEGTPIRWITKTSD